MRFIDKSRKVRKLACIRLKNKIGSRGYWTDHYIDSSEEGWEEGYSDHQWIDVYFLSKKRANVLYNCTFITGCMQYWDACEEVVWDKVKREVGEEVWGRAFGWRKERVRGGYKICYDHKEDRQFVMEKLRQAEREIGIGGEIEIVEKMDERYQYGVGLNATIACDNITGDVIEKWIEGFYARGEVLRTGEKFIVTKEMLDKWNYYRK